MSLPMWAGASVDGRLTIALGTLEASRASMGGNDQSCPAAFFMRSDFADGTKESIET